MFPRAEQTPPPRCGAVWGGGGWEGAMALAQLWAAFSYFLRYPQANWALLVLIPGCVVCVHSRTLWVSPMNSSMRLGVSPTTSTPIVFSVRGFEALFPQAGTLGCAVCLTPQLFLPPAPPATTLPAQVLQPLPLLESSPLQLPISAPPSGLDECLFFHSLVVGLPYSSVFWK